MTVKELKDLLKNYKDTDEVWLSVDIYNDCYGEGATSILYIGTTGILYNDTDEILKEIN